MTFSFPDTKFYREAADKLKDFMADHDSENEPYELKFYKRFNCISLKYGKHAREMRERFATKFQDYLTADK